MTAALVEPLVALHRALADAERDPWHLRLAALHAGADETTREALHNAEDHLLYVVVVLEKLHARLDPAEAAQQEKRSARPRPRPPRPRPTPVRAPAAVTARFRHLTP